MDVPEFLRDDMPIHKSAQKLSWFIDAFSLQVAAVSQATGNLYEIDDTKLTQTFASWVTSFEGQKPESDTNNETYVGFAAGLMLRALVDVDPARHITRPDNADVSKPAYFWPEGYLYVSFCLMVRGLVLKEDYDKAQISGDSLESIKTWWSFRENIAEDKSTAIAFLDLFAGEEPNWTFPQIFRV